MASGEKTSECWHGASARAGQAGGHACSRWQRCCKPKLEVAETNSMSGTRAWARSSSVLGQRSIWLPITSRGRSAPKRFMMAWTAFSCSGQAGSPRSTTISRPSASSASSTVERKASNRAGGRSSMKPTVSVMRISWAPSPAPPRCRRLVVGSRVANSWSAARTPWPAGAPLRALSRELLPALV